MLSWLEDIFDVLVHLPTYLLVGAETLVNLVFEGFEVLINNAAALLPEVIFDGD